MDIVLASSNEGKLRELAVLLRGLSLVVSPQSKFGVDDAVESGVTFVENALIKARHACNATGLPAIADDSGLSVPALNGNPGVRSARYAGEGATDTENTALLLTRMASLPTPERDACFICVMVYLRNATDPLPLITTGVWRGRVLEAPSGEGGFGYDPVFLVPEFECSAADLDRSTKNKVSHRGQAVRALIGALKQELATSS